MSDKPGLPISDAAQVDRLCRLVATLNVDSADGRAGARAILREIEAADPGALERMRAGLQLRRHAFPQVADQ